MLRTPQGWDRVVDVIVLGSGAAGLAAATRAAAPPGKASVLVLEKAALIGGTTGVSGGMPWIPGNQHMADVDITDSREEALIYLRRLTLGREPDPDLLETYVERAPQAMAWLETNTPLRLSAPSFFADYYADLPGGKSRGRSIEPQPFEAAAQLPDWVDRIRTSPYMPPLTMEEGSLATISKGTGATDPGQSIADVITERTKTGVFTMGAALVAALLKGALDHGVEVQTKTAGKELVADENGRVVGIQTDQGQLLGARRGVVLACGGYEWNAELVKAFLPVPEVVPLSPPGNEGDGLLMGLEAGAAVGNMGSAWWYPAMRDPSMTYEGQPLYHLGAGRNLPGVIVVNRHGRRFVNEGTTYMDMPKTFVTFDPVALEFPNEAPVWMIFDRQVKDHQIVFNVFPEQPAPEWMPRSDTLEGLAKEIGVDGDALADTVKQFNQYVAAGRDPDFGRGTFFWENFMQGGPTAATSLRSIEEPPYYAIPIYHGVLGTNGGLRIDRRARVLAARGGVIDGLYAAGNATANVFGPAYPGGGATIGPALTFGYLAGADLAPEEKTTAH